MEARAAAPCTLTIYVSLPSEPNTTIDDLRLTRLQAHYDPLEKVQPVGRFEHDDPGHRADPAMPNLLPEGVETVELSPHCGTEILGVQIVSHAYG